MLRSAHSGDIEAIVELALESVRIDPLPVPANRGAMRAMVADSIRDKRHFVWVSEIDGKVCGCVGARVGLGFWFDGLQCDVLLFHVKRGGEGGLLLRRFARWVQTHTKIRVASFSLEPGADPRIARLLIRLGFARSSQQLSFVR